MRKIKIGPMLVALLVVSSFGCGGGSGGGGANGCTAYVAGSTINFGSALGNTYSPACVKIAVNQSVTWNGDFTLHNLSGGTADSQSENPDASSPIPSTTTGMTASVTFPSAGTFPYFCVQHGMLGMAGAVLVE